MDINTVNEGMSLAEALQMRADIGPCETRQPACAQGANSRGISRKMSDGIFVSFFAGRFIMPKSKMSVSRGAAAF